MAERKKAWLGAAISGLLSIGSSIFGNSQANKAAKEQQAEMQRLQNIKDSHMIANNISNAYADQSYVNDTYKNRVAAYGTSKKIKSSKTNKRIKAGLGWTSDDTNSVISSIGSSFSNMNNAINEARRAKMNNISTKEALPINAKTEVVSPDYIDDSEYIDRLLMLKFGGRCKRK